MPVALRLVAVVADIVVADVVVDNSCFAVEDNMIVNNDVLVDSHHDDKQLGCDCNLHGRENMLSLIHISEPTRPY